MNTPAALKPVAPPPPGITPNLNNPPNMQAVNITIVVICLTITTPIVCMRLYTKFFITKARGWEDYTMFAAWVYSPQDSIAIINISLSVLMQFLSVCFAVVGILFAQVGAGVDGWNLRLRSIPAIRLMAWIVEALYVPTIYLTKLSIILQCIKIFAPVKGGLIYWTSQFLIWFNAMFYLAIFLSNIFQCWPVSAAWLPARGSTCINVNFSIIISAAINVLSDFTILTLPLYAIWHLQMPRHRKVAVAFAFLAGGFACVSSAIRLYFSIKYNHSTDQTYLLIQLIFWSYAEIYSGILAGCIPLLARFWKHFREARRRSSASSDSSQPCSIDKLLPEDRSPMAEFHVQPPFRTKNVPLKVSYEQEEPIVTTPASNYSIQHDLECWDPDVESSAVESSFKKSTRMEARYPSTIFGGKPLPYVPLTGVSRTPSGRF
ncbi:hypothetical protein MMC17_009073 [Xylographa soralifera]|nr:hypothetical protein [Xylographa soralifera]